MPSWANLVATPVQLSVSGTVLDILRSCLVQRTEASPEENLMYHVCWEGKRAPERVDIREVFISELCGRDCLRLWRVRRE